MIRKIFQTILSILIIFSVLTAYANHDSAKVSWGYLGQKGPKFWGQLDPSFIMCDKGKLQSPINIPRKAEIKEDTLALNYQTTHLDIIDDGETNLTIGGKPTVIHDSHGVQINFPDKNKETITFDDNEYRLVQFHFHSPSEDQLQGRAFPLEIHFLHQSDDGKLAVIAVFVKTGKANDVIQEIVESIPRELGKDQTVDGIDINPSELMPSIKNYYSYQGSLTIPPCTEGVNWIIMQNPITASPAQITELRKAANGANARHVQPLNKRKIYYSVFEEYKPKKTSPLSRQTTIQSPFQILLQLITPKLTSTP